MISALTETTIRPGAHGIIQRLSKLESRQFRRESAQYRAVGGCARDGRSETRWNLKHPSRPSLTGSVSSTGCWIRFAISPPYRRHIAIPQSRRHIAMSQVRRHIAAKSPCRHLAVAISSPNGHKVAVMWLEYEVMWLEYEVMWVEYEVMWVESSIVIYRVN